MQLFGDHISTNLKQSSGNTHLDYVWILLNGWQNLQKHRCNTIDLTHICCKTLNLLHFDVLMAFSTLSSDAYMYKAP